MPRSPVEGDVPPRAIIPGNHLASPEDSRLDIIFLLERLESLIATGRSLPLTRSVVVDRDAVLDLVDQLRVAIPEEVRAAKRINSEGERIIDKAEEEASRIVSRAQEQAAFLIGERGLLELAEAEGRRIIDDAQDAGDQVRAGADDYALQILATLEAEVARALAGIQKGMAVLDDRRAELVEVDAETAEEADEVDDIDDEGESMDDEGEDEDARHPAYR
jgi:hypothetical protein